ncbi:MAG: hypothetical protein HYU37_01525 [Acidobacteria bacterium]|nr:hypothetical protein [Acidobacteriota bacterium]
MRGRVLSPAQAAVLPVAFTLALLSLGAFEVGRQPPGPFASIVGGAAALAGWTAVWVRRVRRQRRTLAIEIVLRKQHYLQACAQGVVLCYWGWYWRQVYESASLVLAQLLFAYAVDALLAWSRRDTYTFGFGPFPVIFSINLFLWFRPDWFYLQLMMVALGFVAKELIRWENEGRLVHIFNPSSFPLAIFSLALLVTGTSDLTWGKEIAITQFYPPHMYLVIFLVGLPGQYFFGVTTMTMAAVVATYLFGLLHYATTGTYFFYDSHIPIAVFLGMHLLFTDPSTSPRTELGRIIFGVLYGLSTVVLYQILSAFGLPTFYDKLLQVPILNLSIRAIDRAARSGALQRIDPARLGRGLGPRERHLASMALWALVFGALSSVQGVGDAHPGQWVPFWQQACGQGRSRACAYLVDLQANLCDQGSGWACNERARLVDLASGRGGAASWLRQGCQLGFAPACANGERLAAGDPLVGAPPTVDDFRILLRGSKAPIADRQPAALQALACKQGWADSCHRTAQIGAQ